MRRFWITVSVLHVNTFVELPVSMQAQSGEGLVAKWLFDEGAGSVVKDSSGNGNDGTVYGATWVDGKYGKALSFDGVDDYIRVDQQLQLSNQNIFTTEVWTKLLPSLPGNTKLILQIQGNQMGGNSNNANMKINRDGVAIGWYAAGNSGHPDCPNCWNIYYSSVPLDQWVQIVCVWNTDGKSITSKLYVNGALKSTDRSGLLTFVDSNTYPFIGASSWNSSYDDSFFNGMIDEVLIYERVLGAEEIKQHYEGQQTVLSLTEEASTPKSSADISTASVHLHGEKTDVVIREDILLKLAAVNLITKPTMHVQVIITPPSGMSVTSSEFVQSGAGLFTASYEIEPGVGRDIEVRMRSNQVGDFVVNGRIVCYFGDDMDNAEDHTLTLSITVRAEADAERTADTSESAGSSTPGFTAVAAIIGLLLAYVRRIA